MIIKSYVGGHPVNVFEGAIYDPAIRKYRGGHCVATIPFAGRMLSAKVSQTIAEPVEFEGVEIPTLTPQIFTDVDPIPEDGADFYIVSAMYVNARKALGLDTSKLLMMGGTVVDDDGKIVGVVGFNRN